MTINLIAFLLSALGVTWAFCAGKEPSWFAWWSLGFTCALLFQIVKWSPEKDDLGGRH